MVAAAPLERVAPGTPEAQGPRLRPTSSRPRFAAASATSQRPKQPRRGPDGVLDGLSEGSPRTEDQGPTRRPTRLRFRRHLRFGSLGRRLGRRPALLGRRFDRRCRRRLLERQLALLELDDLAPPELQKPRNGFESGSMRLIFSSSTDFLTGRPSLTCREVNKTLPTSQPLGSSPCGLSLEESRRKHRLSGLLGPCGPQNNPRKSRRASPDPYFAPSHVLPCPYLPCAPILYLGLFPHASPFPSHLASERPRNLVQHLEAATEPQPEASTSS